MRSYPIALALCVVASAAAQAAVNISSRPTQNMSCSAGVCTSTAQKAYLNVNDVASMLAAGNLTVKAENGAQDIHIKAPFSWTSASRLTLDAQRSIEFEKSVVVAGTGALTLTTNDGGTGGDYLFDKGASVTFWDVTGQLVINGRSVQLAKNIKTLAADIAANPAGAFALSQDYDASPDGTYLSAPVTVISFGGILEGLGHTLTNLTIVRDRQQRPHSFGLVGELDGSTVRDIILNKVYLSVGVQYSFLGALVGYNNNGSVLNAYADGTVKGAAHTIVGGLIGNSGPYSSVVRCGASARISIREGGTAGGLVGSGGNLPILNSFARGSIRNVTGGGTYGGLVAAGSAQNSNANTKVTVGSMAYAGGLVGIGSATNSHATGAVTAGDSAVVGGLVGRGGAEASSATGAATAGADSSVGGLIGLADSGIRSSFAAGQAIGGSNARVGGLVGDLEYPYGTIVTSYATGSAAGGDSAYVGGLIGFKEWRAPVIQAYSIGKVTGGRRAVVGGLIGFDAAIHKHLNDNHITAAYLDLDTSGVSDPSRGSGNIANDPGITGLTDSELKAGLPAGFDSTVWRQRASVNNGYPYLRANPPR